MQVPFLYFLFPCWNQTQLLIYLYIRSALYILVCFPYLIPSYLFSLLSLLNYFHSFKAFLSLIS